MAEIRGRGQMVSSKMVHISDVGDRALQALRLLHWPVSPVWGSCNVVLVLVMFCS